MRVLEEARRVTDRLLTAAEVAELLSVPERWIRTATRAGRLPVIELGRYRRYDRDDVLAWLDSCKSGGASMTFRKHRPVRQSGTK